MYDAIIVGARCAGSALALLLARQGYKILVVDRATFPSDTISGHFIWHWGAIHLKRWGLLDKIIESNCPPLTKMATHFGDLTLKGEVPLWEGTPLGIAPRRTVLDKILVDAAREAGAEIREGFIVDKLIFDHDTVVGIEGREQGHNKVKEKAKIVIGADGKHSKVAKMVEAQAYHEVPSQTCWYMSYWSNFYCEGLELNWQPQRIVLTVPTNDDLVLQAVAWPHKEFHAFRSNIEQNFVNTISSMPALAERLCDAKRETEFVGTADVASFLRKPYGKGWALVGDAGHFKDPTPAYGISDAFCDAQLLADTLGDALSGDRSTDSVLAEYHEQRDKRAIPDHQYVCKQAELNHGTDPKVMGLRAALRYNQDATNQFYASHAKIPGSETFFTPENLNSIFQQASMMKSGLAEG